MDVEVVSKDSIVVERRSKWKPVVEKFVELDEEQALKITISEEEDTDKFINNIRQAITAQLRRENLEVGISITTSDDKSEIFVSKTKKRAFNRRK